MEEVKVSEGIKRAFNQGYAMREKMPELLKGIHIPKDEPSEYTKYFQAGVKQCERDIELGRNNPTKNIDKQRSRGFDMGR